MGLQRLFCIPEGCVPIEGAYLRYPLEDLIGILALESHRHQCLLVGEDLGTVPESFRQSMAGANILSYRVLFFEQDWTEGSFLRPSEYPRLAVAVAGSHDLPTLRGWWQARDMQLKDSLGLFPSEADADSQRRQREVDRASLLRALSLEGLVPADREVDPDQFAIAAHEFLARSQAALVICQLDDLLGETDQVNVPGTELQDLNWRRKYSVGLLARISHQG
jgi:4-alpha-glucanotransferase